jgi:hypothetical protein
MGFNITVEYVKERGDCEEAVGSTVDLQPPVEGLGTGV